MMGYQETGKDWSEFTIESAKLRHLRDDALNKKDYSLALKLQYAMEDVELDMSRWIVEQMV